MQVLIDPNKVFDDKGENNNHIVAWYSNLFGMLNESGWLFQNGHARIGLDYEVSNSDDNMIFESFSDSAIQGCLVSDDD